MSESSDIAAKPSPVSIGFWGWPAWTALLVFLLDQGTKIAINHFCQIGFCRQIIPRLFNLVHYRNTGGAWGILSQHTWILGLISLVAFIAFIWVFRSQNKGDKWVAFSFSLLIGGIAGNMVDRIFRHSVIDFLDFHINKAHWPAFNVADSAICVAVFLLLLLSFRKEKTKDAGK